MHPPTPSTPAPTSTALTPASPFGLGPWTPSRRQVLAMGAVGGLGVLLAGAGPIGAARADTTANPLDWTISDFEDKAIWSVAVGGEYGSHVLDADAHGGEWAARLSGDFTTAGQYIQIQRALNKDITSLSWWIKPDGPAAVRLRLVDSTGRTHQQKVPVTGTDWQQVTIDTFDGGADYIAWGGTGGAPWQGPARSVALILDRMDLPTPKVGTFLLDDVTAVVRPPTLGFEQVAPGNIFVTGTVPAVDIQSQGSSVQWTLANLDGSQAAAGELTMTTSQERLTWPSLPVGYYTLTATAIADGAAIATQQTPVALLVEHATATPSSPFAVCTHVTGSAWNDPGYGLIEVLRKAGAGGFREDAFWSSIELAAGEYTYTRYDAMVEAADAADVTWLPIAAYTNALYDNNSTPYTDEARAAYASYAVDLQQHYGASTPAIEVYNEYNIAFGDRGDGPADSRADYYFPMLKQTYEAIKAASPDTVVVGGATAGVPLAWLEELFALGGLEYMDVLSIHPYRYPNRPDGLDTVLSDLNALVRRYNNGNTIPLWITEQGWVTGTNARAVSEQSQADYVVQTHVRAFAGGVERFYWYDLMNDGVDLNNTENNFGLMRNHADALGRWTAKPAYVAYSTMTAELATAAFDHREDVGGDIASFVFTRDGQPLRVLWSASAATVTLAATGDVRVVDLNGRATVLQAADGEVHLTLSDSPVFVTGRISGATPTTLLSFAGPATAILGGTVTTTLRVNNEGRRHRITGRFEVGGTSVPVRVPAGSSAEFEIAVDAGDLILQRRITGSLVVQGRHSCAALAVDVAVQHPLEVGARHVLDGDVERLRVSLTNVADATVAAGEVTWTIGEHTGSVASPAIDAGGVAAVDVDLTGIPVGSYTSTLVFHGGGVPDQRVSTRVVISDPAARLVTPYRTITLDGSPVEVADLPSLDLLADGVVKVSGHAGADDLSGQIWSTWDEDRLYVVAVLVDDTHFQQSTSDQIYIGDSLQIGISHGAPGEATDGWYELGVALGANGPMTYQWMSPEGVTGPVDGAEAVIVRDDATHTTTYEIAIPWTSIGDIDPTSRLLSLSYAINDNDGQGRRGYIEVGSGIGGTKDCALFLPVALEPRA